MDQQLPLYEKWVIIPVVAAPKAVTRIDHRIPANVIHCTGVAFSVIEAQGAFNPNNMGEVSLLFNNRKSHPLNFHVECRLRKFRLDEIILKLDEPINGGSHVSGYYRNPLCIPHTVNIYLQCIAQTN
jgi:hypothetical protein